MKEFFKNFMKTDSNQFNISHLIHAGYATLISGVAIGLGHLTGFASPLLAFAGTLPFIGREHTHAESKIAKELGASSYTWEVTSKAFNVFNWDTDTKLDLASCIIVNSLLSYVDYKYFI